MTYRKFETVRVFEYKGYKCIIKRNPFLKALLGYIKLPKEHKYYGTPIADIPIECHGDLTYGEIQGDDYVIGFDCGHVFDFDLDKKIFDSFDPEYPLGTPNKDENFVLESIKEIVNQLGPYNKRKA